MRFRRLAVWAAPVTAVLVLAGCQAPNPSITVFSGSSSANPEALCWSPDADRAFTPDDCAITPDEINTGTSALAGLADLVPAIDVVPDSTIGVSVDTEVADAGWTITLNNKPLSPRLLTTTYHRFSLSESAFRKGPIVMKVFAATDDGKLTRGLWIYELLRAGAT